MYQSFPQRHISQSASAMPIAKETVKMPSESVKTEHFKEKKEREKNSEKTGKKPPEKAQNEKNADEIKTGFSADFLQSLSLDDIIIIGLIILLIYEGSEDYLTIGLLAAVLLF